MPVTNESALVEFDADAAVDIALDASDDEVLASAEYTVEDFQILYAGDGALDEYDDADLQATGETLHAYLNVDSPERELFEGTRRDASGSVRGRGAAPAPPVVAL
jgi:hypothetical protein